MLVSLSARRMARPEFGEPSQPPPHLRPPSTTSFPPSLPPPPLPLACLPAITTAGTMARSKPSQKTNKGATTAAAVAPAKKAAAPSADGSKTDSFRQDIKDLGGDDEDWKMLQGIDDSGDEGEEASAALTGVDDGVSEVSDTTAPRDARGRSCTIRDADIGQILVEGDSTPSSSPAVSNRASLESSLACVQSRT